MLSIRKLIELVFPRGTNPDHLLDEKDVKTAISSSKQHKNYWGDFPPWPPDMFAMVALLVKRTGAYTFVKPGLPRQPNLNMKPRVPAKNTTDPFGIFGENGTKRFDLTVLGHAWRHGLIFVDGLDDNAKLEAELTRCLKAIKEDALIGQYVQDALIDLCKPESKETRQNMRLRLQRLWHYMYQNLKDIAVVEPASSWEILAADRERLILFRIILKLFIIADEACAGLGHYYDSNKEVPWLISMQADFNEAGGQELEDSDLTGTDDNSADKLDTQFAAGMELLFTLAASDSIAPVIPKARTTSLGCSLRSLSRNMALAPFSSEVQATWNNYSYSERDERFNVLIIPFPNEIPHNVFFPSFTEDELQETDHSRKWRWFSVKQSWLPERSNTTKRDKLVADFIEIIRAAIRETDQVHAVIFPELALDFDLMQRLSTKMAEIDDLYSIEILISGTSDGPVKTTRGDDLIASESRVKHGNFVCTAHFSPGTNDDGTRRDVGLSLQRKHHRWKLTGSQIIDYGAAFRLLPDYDWWENINISERKLNFWAFRQQSVLATLICEDLARNDPAQQILRAVGPSLLVAILMDGPQLTNRWPGLYASALADDPGSSVLTVSSNGLMRGRRNGGRYEDSYNIALWRQRDSAPRELKMDPEASGLVLNLEGVSCATHSLDGRYQPDDAREWRLVGIKDVYKQKAAS